MKKLALAFAFACVFICVFIYKKNQSDIKSGNIFGTYYRIITLGENTVFDKIEDIFDEVNNEMSIFTANSKINELNDLKAFQKLKISKELAFIIAKSKEIYTHTKGAFDPSLATLIDLWGFGLKDKKQDLSQEQIENALKDASMDKVILEGLVVYKTRDNLRLNLSAIAKGYAVDKIASLLKENGYNNFLVDIGGEVYAKGNSDIFGNPWTVAIQNPSEESGALMPFNLDNLAIATSGDYANFIEENGERYSHTIDSKSGRPIKNKLASVSVFNESAMLADAYATALLAMGETNAISFAKENNIKAIFIIREKNQLYILKNFTK